MLEDVRCAKEALQLAMNTFRDQFPKYDPLVNGNKALHCLGNCMLVKRCGFGNADFTRLMEANKTYEMCTAGPPDFERCTDWCADSDGYTEDVFTDFKADAVGLCAGFAGKDCNEACKEARMDRLDPKIGPQQPTCEPTYEQVTSCIEQEKKNPAGVQAIVDTQYEKFTRDYPEISYEGVCNNLP